MNKKRVIVVCPGRGSYTRETKGYVSEFGGPAQEYIKWMDDQRVNDNCEPLTKLDSMPFRSKTHMTGENASPLIYACSLSDFLSIEAIPAIENFDKPAKDKDSLIIAMKRIDEN